MAMVILFGEWYQPTNYTSFLSFPDDIKLTNSMQLSPFREALSYSAPQRLPKIVCNPKVHYRVYKSLSLIHILSQINPAHPAIYLSSILMLYSYLCLRLPSGLLPSGLPTNVLHTFLFSSCVLHAPRHFSLLILSFYIYICEVSKLQNVIILDEVNINTTASVV
jgi:hypothetical protein